LRFGIRIGWRRRPARTKQLQRKWRTNWIYEPGAIACCRSKPEHGEKPAESLQNEAGKSAAEVRAEKGGRRTGRREACPLTPTLSPGGAEGEISTDQQSDAQAGAAQAMAGIWESISAFAREQAHSRADGAAAGERSGGAKRFTGKRSCGAAGGRGIAAPPIGAAENEHGGGAMVVAFADAAVPAETEARLSECEVSGCAIVNMESGGIHTQAGAGDRGVAGIAAALGRAIRRWYDRRRQSRARNSGAEQPRRVALWVRPRRNGDCGGDCYARAIQWPFRVATTEFFRVGNVDTPRELRWSAARSWGQFRAVRPGRTRF